MEFTALLKERSRRGACLLLGFIFLWASAGCGSSKRFYDPGYEPDDFRKSAVAYLPIKASGVHIESYEAYRKSFNTNRDEDGDSILAVRFNEHFIKHSKSAMKGLTVLDENSIPVEGGFFETKQLLNAGKKNQTTFRFWIPKIEAMQNLKVPARYLVSAKDAKFTYSQGAVNPQGGTLKEVKMSVKYMIWDYEKEAPVAYGTINGGMTANFFFTKEEWIALMEDASRALLALRPMKINSTARKSVATAL